MSGSTERVMQAFAHQQPDRTPLFEIFWDYQPIYWDVCGRTVATDQALCWDAMADGIAWEELVEADARAHYQICKFFELDMVRIPGTKSRNYPRPVKVGEGAWTLHGVEYVFNPRTKLVELAHPGEADSYSHRNTEDDVIARIESWDGIVKPVDPDQYAAFTRFKEFAELDGMDWVYMGEIGAGTGAAFYPPFMLIWMLTEPELYSRWLAMQKAYAFPATVELIARGCTVIAMGGDVSCDKGPFISPTTYHEWILPVIREHVDLIHQHGAKAVYTSDGNHWPIKDDFFFHSGIDGYKEVDNAAGMTMERLVAEGVKDRVCIIGNIDARHTLCQGTPDDVRREVLSCLQLGQQGPGGHILHTSHSVHEDVIVENYYAMANAYREYFGLAPLPVLVHQ
jgi:hypothetical protein